jgi:murein L,D-transpeptidase YcbB/YkuD
VKTRSHLADLLPIALLLLAATPVAAQDTAAATVRALMAAARHPWARWPDFSPSVDVVGWLYAPGDAAPLWVRAGAASPAARAAIRQLLAAPEEGLDPRDYDAAVLDSMAGRLAVLPPEDRARFDVLLTVDLVRFLDDVRRGRLRDQPLAGKPRPAGPDLVSLVSGALAGDSLPRLVRAVEPQLAQYHALRVALARYRRLAGDTSLGGLPAGEFLWPGRGYDSLARLSRTLVAFGDLAPDSAPSGTAYDGPIVAAVRRFQQRNALTPDGVLGPFTLAAVNAPVSDQVRRIELALERLRWVPPIGPQRFLVVNIPAFQLVGFDSATAPGPPALSMRVVVGRAMDTRTPVLLEQLRYVEFLPYWNVPWSILTNEILPMLEWNPGYLRTNDMELVAARGRVFGDSVTPALLRRLRRGELRVRQRPGPGNALGLAKFIFPNSESVYLHGTPRTDRFAQSQRDFTHGCISVEDPSALAAWVLRDQPQWARDEIAAAMSGAEPRRAMMNRAMPVLVFYTTAVVHADGSMWFYPDVYGHDRELAEALRAGPDSHGASHTGAQ